MKQAALLLLASAFVVSAQTPEDFACSAANAITQGATTTITCNADHGFANDWARVILLGLNSASLTNGKTASVDGKTYTFVTTINNANNGEVLIETPVVTDGVLTGTPMNLYNAVNDTGVGEGTKYSSATTAHATFQAFKPGHINQVTLHYVTTGSAGIGKVLSAQSPMAWTSGSDGDTTSDIWWRVQIKGGTGAWADLGSDASPRYIKAIYASASTFTVARNSTGYSPNYATYLAAGNPKIQIYRGNNALQRMFYEVNNIQGTLSSRIPEGSGVIEVTTPNCDEGESEALCSEGYWNPDNQKAYMTDTKISPTNGFVVSGGTITVTLNSNWVDNTAGGYEALAIGRLIHIRGLQQYTTATNPGYDGTANDPAQPCAAAFAKNVGSQTSRGFYVQTLVGSPGAYTGFTINNPSDCPLQNGTYILSCLPANSCIGRTQAEGFAAITWRASPYLYMSPRGASAHIAPDGYTNYYVKGEVPDADNNRLCFDMTFTGIDNPRSASGGLDFNIGTYPQTVLQDTIGSGSHFYHFNNLSVYDGRPIKTCLTGAPDHQVGAAGGINWPAEPLMGHPFYPGWGGGARKYMQGLTILYFDPVAYKGPWKGTMRITPPTFSKATGEPEELMRTRSITYSANRFLPSDGYTALQSNAGYDANWQAAPVAGLTFKIRYSTSCTSLKTSGFSTGTDGGIVTPPGVATSVSGSWFQSPTMAEQACFQVAARPVVPVIGVSGNGQNPIWITSPNDIGVNTGDTVTTAGIGGNTAANQTNAVVADVQPRKFWFRFQPRPATSWTGNGDLTSIVAASNVCTVQLNGVNHDLVVGRVVEVAGSTNTTLGLVPSGVPKLYTVSEIVNSTSFRFPCTGVPNGTYNTDGVSAGAIVHLVVATLPAYALPGSGNGTYTSGGFIESTEDNTGFGLISTTEFVSNAPNAPSSFTATANGSSAIDLAWTDNSANETGFEIERCTGASCSNYSPLITKAANAVSHADSGLAAGTVYGYRLRAVNVDGASAWVTASATTDAGNPAPTAPSALSVVFRVDSRIIVGWTDNSNNETSFVLQIDDGGGFVDAATLGANITTATVIGLTPNSSYSFRVKGVNGAGSSAWSSTLVTSTLSAMPLTFPRLTSSGVVVRYKTLDGAACSILLPSGTISSDAGGNRNRDYPLLDLQAETNYNVAISCTTIGGRATFATPQAMGGTVTVPIKRPRPAGASAADNFVIYTGLTSDSLAFNKSVACATPTCETTLTVTPDAPTFIEVRWCLNRATDDSCANTGPGGNLKYKTTLGTVGLPPRPPTPPTP